MYDWQERQVIYRQKRWGEIDGNVIVYSYVPQFSEFHMMKPVQVNKQKKKNLCGYVMLFKRSGSETGSPVPQNPWLKKYKKKNPSSKEMGFIF